MSTNIKDMLDSIPNTRKDWKEDWKEDAKKDWKIDWDSIPGDLPALAPSFSAPPVITGTAQNGQMLSVSTGTWLGNPAPVLTYQWKVNSLPVMGATTNTYMVQPADIGFMVTCVVTGTNVAGFAAATAVAVGPVIA